jgi:hypothetical protein
MTVQSIFLGVFLLSPLAVTGFVAPRAVTPSSLLTLEATSVTTTTGVARNENFAKLAGGYLFPEIGRRRNAYLEDHPEMASRIISLGIGDTYVVLVVLTESLNGLTFSSRL